MCRQYENHYVKIVLPPPHSHQSCYSIDTYKANSPARDLFSVNRDVPTD